jgi:integrase
LLPVLRYTVPALKAARHPAAIDSVFATTTGAWQNPSNIRNRVLAPAVKRANLRLDGAGDVPLPERITPHKLHHTFASLLVGRRSRVCDGSARPHRSGIHAARIQARDAS